MVKPKKKAKTNAQSTNELDGPLVVVEGDLPQKERTKSSSNNSRATGQSNSDRDFQPKLLSNSTNNASSQRPLVLQAPNDSESPSHTIATGSPKQRDLAVLVQSGEQAEEGYDTEGKFGPFFNAQAVEGPQEFVEEPLPVQQQEQQDDQQLRSSPKRRQAKQPQNKSTNQEYHVQQIQNETVQWIHRKLRLRCLPIDGKKQETLIPRLADAMANDVPQFDTVEEAKQESKRQKKKNRKRKTKRPTTT